MPKASNVYGYPKCIPGRRENVWSDEDKCSAAEMAARAAARVRIKYCTNIVNPDKVGPNIMAANLWLLEHQMYIILSSSPAPAPALFL